MELIQITEDIKSKNYIKEQIHNTRMKALIGLTRGDPSAEASSGTVISTYDTTPVIYDNETIKKLDNELSLVLAGFELHPLDQVWPPSKKHDTVKDIYEYFNQRISSFPYVRAILGLWDSEDETIDFWTIIEKLDINIEKPIYEREMELINKFPHYQYDFHIIVCPKNRNIEDILPSDATLLYRRYE